MKIQNRDFWNQLGLRPKSARLHRFAMPRFPCACRSLASLYSEANQPVLGLFLRTLLKYSKCSTGPSANLVLPQSWGFQKKREAIHDLLGILQYTHPLKWKKLMLVSLKLRCRRAFARVVFPLLSAFGKPFVVLASLWLCKSQSVGGKKGRPSSSNPSVRLSPHSAPARYCRKSIS